MSNQRNSQDRRRSRSRSQRDDSEFERRSSAWVGVKQRLRNRALYRDKENGIILGICAGIALYFGVERYVVRLIVIAGIFFGLAGVIIPAYFILYFILEDVSKVDPNRDFSTSDETEPGDSFDEEDDTDSHRNESSREARSTSQVHDQPPRIALRSVRATIQSLELRMRHMEKFVTSSNFELNKELHNL